MWSVVTESPTETRQRAPTMSATGVGSGPCRRSTAAGARRWSRPPTRTARRRHRELAPGLLALVHVSRRCSRNISRPIAAAIVSCTCRRGPDVAQEHGVAVGVRARAARDQVDVHPPGQRVGDDERRRGEVVGLDLRVDPRLEVAVAGEDRARRRGRPRRSPSRPPPAAGRSSRCTSCSRSRPCGSRAPRGRASGPTSRSTRSRPSSPGARLVFTHGLAREAALDRLLREQAGADHHGRVGRVRAAT